MSSISVRGAIAAPPLPVADRNQRRRHRAGSTPVRRRLLSLSPLLATALLTAAIFLLPATGDRQQAAAWVDDITVSASHIGDGATKAPTAIRE